ncbi:MAG: heterocyst differentiation protein HetZ [Cyanothece sp. SIO1E1]|nr:heterocyst differentiation protein HetZ [Cyanothece sp. SIO1E1]
MEETFQLVLRELQQSIQASERDCLNVADRIASEVTRICTESKRIQDSGEVKKWATNLGKLRVEQCVKYYRLGSHQGRVELHSALSAIVYRYITPPQTQSSYQARLNLIEDFLQGFYVESLHAFRRETQTPTTYQPRTLLELAEYMAFTERYGKRRIPLPGRRNQQLIILRAQTFSQQQPPETSVDIEQAAEGASGDSDDSWNATSMQQVREQILEQEPEPGEESLRVEVIDELMAYLKERKQEDCADYFALRLKDLPAHEIEAILHLTPRERDYLQQRFKYHLIRFALSHRWELVHQWLEADLERNLGLTPQQWKMLHEAIPQKQVKLLEMKQQGSPDTVIAQALGCTPNQVQKQWSKLLEHAWEIRNSVMSGSRTSAHE